jgi:hypothetical protein
MTITYPVGPITPHGEYYVMKGTVPEVTLKAYDDSIHFFMMGGKSIPDKVNAPESVQLEDVKGLIPPWQHIDQKAATQDGVTNIDTLYDPIEVALTVACRGKTSIRTRQVVRDLIASIDAKQQSELSWSTPDGGYWWAPVRWFKGAPDDALMTVPQCRQRLSLRLRADNGFWRTFDDTASFSFSGANQYESMLDTFAVDHSGTQDLGVNWPQYYTGTGGYYSTIVTSGLFTYEQARWVPSGTSARQVVNGPYKDFATDTDNQIVEMVIGNLPQLLYLPDAYNDLWARMSRDGSGNWTGYGIRARVGMNGLIPWVRLSRFNNFVEAVMKEGPLGLPPITGEKYSLAAGVFGGDPRQFKVLRNGFPVLSFKELGADSALGAAYRGVGFGAAAGPGSTIQTQPAWVRKVSAADNNNGTVSGFLARSNIGDQKMYDDYTVFGPGTFRFADGPGSADMVEFGPLLPNQIAFIRTDPRKRSVQDLTVTPPTPQEAVTFQSALMKFISFATGNNIFPLLQAILSPFGVKPPQGNMYSLLDGRFSDNAAIPPKSPGAPATPYYVKVEIVGGNSDSRVIAAGTPLRRWPL